MRAMANVLSPETELETTTLTMKLDLPIRVLLVEDDPEAADLVRFYLRPDNDVPFHLEHSSNLIEAMDRLASPGIDVILLDLGLPELSGHTSYRAVLIAAKGKIPIVIFTGDESSSSRNLTLQFGAAGYLVKDKSTPAQVKYALRTAIRTFRFKHLA